MTPCDDVQDTHVFIYAAREAWAAIDAIGESGVLDAQWHSDVLTGVAPDDFIRRLPPAIEVERLLDRHVVLYMGGDVESRRAAELRLFDHIAATYELEIDPQRNRDNVRNLLERVVTRPGARVLDFGCGSGLSVSVASLQGHVILGCDVSSRMRQRASANGLPVMNVPGLSRFRGWFDGAIASYVMHLALPEADLTLLLQSLRVGGRLAANFHKSKGLDDIEKFLEVHPEFQAVTIAQDRPVPHGPVRVWRRIR